MAETVEMVVAEGLVAWAVWVATVEMLIIPRGVLTMVAKVEMAVTAVTAVVAVVDPADAAMLPTPLALAPQQVGLPKIAYTAILPETVAAVETAAPRG